MGTLAADGAHLVVESSGANVEPGERVNVGPAAIREVEPGPGPIVLPAATGSAALFAYVVYAVPPAEWLVLE